jgi:integrase
MPKLTRKPPAYSLHKPSGQARVRSEGRDYYLGTYGSRESREAYARLIAEFSKDLPPPAPAPTGPTVSEIILAYWSHAQTYYRRADGSHTGEHLSIKAALKPLRRLYGTTPAAEFRAKELRLLREEMIRLGWSRRYINSQIGRTKHAFAWAVSEDLVPEAVIGSHLSVKGLSAGRSKAREKPSVEAVPDEVIDATLPHLPPIVADIVRLLRLSGARIGEILGITSDQLDRTDPSCWCFTPDQHKTIHKGKGRAIYFGPKAIAILSPYLVSSGGKRLFQYQRDSVRIAIARTCAAHGIPHWHPHMVRHTTATAVRARFGLETSQVLLGHAEADVTQLYAAVDATRAIEAMRSVG